MDANCCAECGFTTTNISAFTTHVEQHEEDQKTVVKTEWCSAASSGGEMSPTSSPPLASNIDIDEEMKTALLTTVLRPLDGILTASSSNGSDEEKMICSSSSSSGSVSPNEGEVTSINAATQAMMHANKMLMEASMPLTPETVKKSNKAMHVCPHCNFTTFMSQHMKSHLEAHERHQGQMYQCDICQMQFSQKANMHRHRMRHSGVKPYECRYCKKRFFRKDQMQEHSMTHIKTGADFDCPVAFCTQQFSQHSALRSHLDESHQITSGSPASCKRCSLLFANSRRLLLHYQTKHDDGDTTKGKSESFSETSASPTSSPPKKRRTSASVCPPALTPQTTIPTSLPMVTSASNLFMATPSVITSFAAQHANPLALLQSRLEEMVKLHSLNAMASQPTASLLPPTSSSSPFRNGLITPSLVLPQTTLTVPTSSSSSSIEVTAPKVERFTPEYENGACSLTNEELLLALSNQAQSSLFSLDQTKDAFRMTWPSESVSNFTATQSEDQSHSPSLDSNHSATEMDEELTKETQECTHCDITFRDKTMYLLHKGLHSEFEPWKCNLCGHNCGDKYMFATHVISVDHSN